MFLIIIIIILGSCLSYNFAEVVKSAVITYNITYVCLFLSLKGNPIFKLYHLFGLMGFIYDSCSNSGHCPPMHAAIAMQTIQGICCSIHRLSW